MPPRLAPHYSNELDLERQQEICGHGRAVVLELVRECHRTEGRCSGHPVHLRKDAGSVMSNSATSTSPATHY